jgi:hypothetical protein
MWEFQSMEASRGTVTTVLGPSSEELVHAFIQPSVLTTGNGCLRTNVCMSGLRGFIEREEIFVH